MNVKIYLNNYFKEDILDKKLMNMEIKKMLCKAINLDRCLKMYNDKEGNKKEVFSKFERVWGTSLANHFLGKYDAAESLIWALDQDNFNLFKKYISTK